MISIRRAAERGHFDHGAGQSPKSTDVAIEDEQPRKAAVRKSAAAFAFMLRLAFATA